MNRRPSRRLTLYIVLGALAAAAIVLGLNEIYGFFNSPSASVGVQRTATVTRGVVQSSVTASGNVGVARSAAANFSTSGTVTSVSVRVGHPVGIGKELAALDPTSAQAALDASKANLAQAQSTLAAAESGPTAEQQAANSSSLQQAEVEVSTAKQQLSTDQAALATAQQQLAASQKLDCPPAPSSSGSGGSAASSSSAAGSSSSGGSSGASSSSSGSSTSGGSSSSSGTGSSGGGSSTTGSHGSSGTGSSGTGSSGTGSSGTSSAGTSSAGTSSAGTSSAGTSSAGTSSAGTSSAGTSSAGSGSSGSGSSGTGSSGSGSSAAGSSSSSGGGSGAGSSGAGGSTAGGGSTATTPTSTVAGIRRGVRVASLAALAPTVTTGQATGVGSTSATLGGSVNPGGAPTTYHFLYGTSPTSLSSSSSTQDAGSGTGAVPVAITVTGLSPGRNYWFQLVATNSDGPAPPADLGLFTTAAAAPPAGTSATTGQATAVTSTGATLNGTVNPAGLDTSYHFQYGTSASSLGSSTATLDAGSGSTAVPVATTLTGLGSGQNYWYQLVATSSSGTVYGATMLLTTAAGAATSATTGQAASIESTTATLNGSVNPAGQDTGYHFEYGTSPTSLGSSTATVDIGSGSTAVPVSAAVTGLAPGLNYWFRVVATNTSGTTDGALTMFTTGTLALATTGQAAPVGSTTATLNGSVSPGGLGTTYYFQYGTSATSLGSATAKKNAGSGASSVPVSAAVTGLKAGLSYWFRLVATNASGTSDGALTMFTTGTLALATTGQAAPVGSTTATLNGSVSPGGLKTTYSFQYGTSATSLGSSTPKQNAGSGSTAVPVSAALTGLKPGLNYWFRLVASNSSGTTDGALTMFTTGTLALATTAQASPVNSTTATLNGSVSPGGVGTSYYFQYGTSATSLGSSTPKQNAGSGSSAVPVNAPLSGLKPNTVYVFRLVAVNPSGTTDGALASFTTGAPALSATTGQASPVGSTTATVSGTVDPGGLETTYSFRYGTSAAGLSSQTAKQSAGSGSGSVPVSATVAGLKPDTAYIFQLVATNSSGSSEGVQGSFTTSSSARPTVTTDSASGVLSSSVTLTGTVNPNGADTTYWFEYGTTSAYGSKTAPVDAGSGLAAAQASALVSGLKPGTMYAFRLVAKNEFGTSTGISQTVTTAASSCTTDEQAVAAAEQTVQNQEEAVKSAELSLAQTEATIAASTTPSSATIAQDQAAVQQAEATVAADQAALDATVLTAPITGTVTAVNGSVGSTVSGSGSTVTLATSSSSGASSSSSAAGNGSSSGGGSSSSSAFITIDSLHQLEVVAGFAEADASKLAVGQPATLTFPALPETQVAGRVIAVATSSTVVSNVVTYDVTIALINPPREVKQGMTTNVSVVTDTRNRVLLLPSNAITTTGAISTVQLLQNGKTTTTPITIGLVGNSSTQIVAGLHAGDVVVEPTVTVTAASSSSTPGGGVGGLFGGGGGGGGGGGFVTRGG